MTMHPANPVAEISLHILKNICPDLSFFKLIAMKYLFRTEANASSQSMIRACSSPVLQFKKITTVNSNPAQVTKPYKARGAHI
jgi:hypothetical protein